jgi:putative oxidoreductase
MMSLADRMEAPAQELVRFPGLSASVALVGRLLLSAILLISVTGKLVAPAGTIAYIASAGLPFPQIAFAIAGFVELVGGLALIAGYHTRIVAGALAIFCVAAALGFHNNLADQNQLFHFFKNVAMAGGLLQIVAFGAGAFSVDGRRH